MRHLIFLLMVLSVFQAHSQVGIQTTNPAGVLEMNSTTMGIIPPRISLTSLDTASPVVNPAAATPTNLENGTLIYNIATDGTYPNNVYPGFYYWEVDRWIRIQNSPPKSAKWEDNNDTNNVNDNGSENNLIETNLWNDDTSLFVVPTGSDDDVLVTETGRYRVKINMILREVDNPQVSISFRLRVSSNPNSMSADSGPFRFVGATYTVDFSDDGNIQDDFRTVNIDEVVVLNENEDISIFSQRISGNTGQIQINNSRGFRSTFYIERIY